MRKTQKRTVATGQHFFARSRLGRAFQTVKSWLSNVSLRDLHKESCRTHSHYHTGYLAGGHLAPAELCAQSSSLCRWWTHSRSVRVCRCCTPSRPGTTPSNSSISVIGRIRAPGREGRGPTGSAARTRRRAETVSIRIDERGEKLSLKLGDSMIHKRDDNAGGGCCCQR